MSSNISISSSSQTPASGVPSIDRYLAEPAKVGPWTGMSGSASSSNSGGSGDVGGSRTQSVPTSGGANPGYGPSMAASQGSAHGKK